MIHISNIVEILALLIALYFYPYLRGSFMKWFLPFLFFISVLEIIANCQVIYYKEQAIMVNYLIAIIESIFYGFIFYSLSSNIQFKKKIIFFISISVIGYIVSYFIDTNSISLFFPNLFFSGFCITGFALIHLYSMFIEDDQHKFILEPGFWIAAGVAFFFIGISITLSCNELIRDNNISIYGVNLGNAILRFFSVILYISLSISIILCKKQTKVSY